MTLSIGRDHIKSHTYQKKMNLYLYIPPLLGHSSSSIIKGTIFGLMSRYYAQNSHRWDYIHFIKLLLSWWRQWEAILSIFLVAEARGKSPSPITANNHIQTYYVRQYSLCPLAVPPTRHPATTNSTTIQRTLCGKTLQAICKDRTIVFYSRLHNIGEYFTQTKLQEPAEYSTEWGVYRDELDSSYLPQFSTGQQVAMPTAYLLCQMENFYVSFSMFRFHMFFGHFKRNTWHWSWRELYTI